MSQSTWQAQADNSAQDNTPPTLIPAPGAPMPPRLTPNASSSSSSFSWDASVTQAAHALAEIAHCQPLKPTNRVCPTIPEVVSDENTERAPCNMIKMDTTSESTMPRINGRPTSVPTASSHNSLSSMDEAATLIRPHLPSPALSHNDVIRSLDSLQYDSTNDLIQAWLVAAPNTNNP